MVFDLLIIYKDRTETVIKSVKAYGINEPTRCFYYEKNGFKSFFPVENVRFIGRYFDYKGESYEG